MATPTNKYNQLINKITPITGSINFSQRSKVTLQRDNIAISPPNAGFMRFETPSPI